jgi:hypothetical protein
MRPQEAAVRYNVHGSSEKISQVRIHRSVGKNDFRVCLLSPASQLLGEGEETDGEVSLT